MLDSGIGTTRLGITIMTLVFLKLLKQYTSFAVDSTVLTVDSILLPTVETVELTAQRWRI